MRLPLQPLSLSLLLLYTLAVEGAAVFKWPNPQLDMVDETLFTASFLQVFVQHCASRDNTTIAAQWVRIAYHDMSTHNVDDGSGGLDASILYELDRPQNVGVGMQASLNDFHFFTTPYIGLADIIAMGTPLAVASCGGPLVPYRAGRVDTTVAGPATVPEPQQDLQTHIESFRRQGFTQSEMIALVACGHTLGGVSPADFPTIVDGPGFATFDTTLGQFDNNIVNEYLQGTTNDPLITTANVTTRSDLRIFSSDGNSTMQSISSPESFNSTCSVLLERMINTVPQNVQLTDVVEPIENKVRSVSLATQNGTYVLSAVLRRLTANPNRKVTLFWRENESDAPNFCPSAGCPSEFTTAMTVFPSTVGQLYGIDIFTYYNFQVPIPLNTSISKFWFTVDEQDGSSPQMVDNGGSGYVIEQDTVLHDPGRSTISGSACRFVVAVRSSTFTPSNPPMFSAETYLPGTPESVLPIISTSDFAQDADNPPADGYTFFVTQFDLGVQAVHVNTTVGGQEYKLYVENDDFTMPLL